MDISAKPGQRKKRSDTKYCPPCRRLKNLRLVGAGVISTEQARALGTVCGICGEDIDLMVRKPDALAPSIDHIVPRALGGTDDLANLQMAHFGCNQRKHLRPANADYGRSERQRFYLTYPWKKFSRQYRLDNPSCASCGEPAWCVDHIVPIEAGGAVWNLDNLQSLCRRCHNRKSQDEYRRRWSSLV